MLTPENYIHIINTVVGWFLKAPADIQAEFKNNTEQSLIKYHHSLGTQIRNEFLLWEHPWEPEIVDGVDMSPNHPDSVSQRIIVDVWKRHTSPE